MVKYNYKDVSLRVHEDFFKGFFEPERKKLSVKFGVNLTQKAFTEYLYKSGAKIKYPKRIPKQNINNNFSPKLPKLRTKYPFGLI